MHHSSISVLYLFAAVALVEAGDPVLQPIFNGKDLSGWRVPKGNEKTGWFTVADGLLKLQNVTGTIAQDLWTVKSYEDFVIEFDFRLGPGVVDRGIFLRNQDQIQIGLSASLKRDMTGSPFIPGKGYPKDATGVADVLKPLDWNSMRIEARGPRYKVWLNGKKVLDYSSDTAIKEGPVGIQLHPGKDVAVDYRNIKLAELP